MIDILQHHNDHFLCYCHLHLAMLCSSSIGKSGKLIRISGKEIFVAILETITETSQHLQQAIHQGW